MPTYTYACKDCGERMDVVRSFSDAPLTDCPRCGGTVRQVFKPAGIVFKGSGWHIKDYGSSSSSAATTAGDSSSGSDGTGSSDTTSSNSSSSSSSDTTSASASSSPSSSD